MRFAGIGLCVTLMVSSAAVASPGVGDPVYGAQLEPGKTEFEMRYGRLTGGRASGEDGVTLELEHAFTDRFAGAILVETERLSGQQRVAHSVSAEGIYRIGRIEPLSLDVAVYGEYKFGLRGESDVLEGKLLLQHRAGGFDSRLNLIGQRPLRQGEPVALSYATSADWALLGDELRVGFAAFGDLGSTTRFGGRQQHFAGPVLKAEIEHLGRGGLEIEAGWLRAFGSARDETNGQARLLLGYELHF